MRPPLVSRAGFVFRFQLSECPLRCAIYGGPSRTCFSKFVQSELFSGNGFAFWSPLKECSHGPKVNTRLPQSPELVSGTRPLPVSVPPVPTSNDYGQLSHTGRPRPFANADHFICVIKRGRVRWRNLAMQRHSNNVSLHCQGSSVYVCPTNSFREIMIIQTRLRIYIYSAIYAGIEAI